MPKKTFLKRIKSYVVSHKILSSVIFIVIIVGGYYLYNKLFSPGTVTTYTLSSVRSGNISSTISGTGQVSTNNQIDIKSKTSGDIKKIYVKTGDNVKAGQLIASLDTRDAEIALESARLAYAKFVKPADELSLLQAQNAVTQAENSKENLNNTLKQNIDNGLSNVSSAFTDMSTVLNGINDLLGTGVLSDNKILNSGEKARNYRKTAESSYYLAKKSYDELFKENATIIRGSSDSERISLLVLNSYSTLNLISQALKDTRTALEYLKDSENSNDSSINSSESDLADWTNSINSKISSLQSNKNVIENYATDLTDANQTIVEKKQALSDLVRGPDSLDVQSQALTLRQKEYAYADNFIRAPFDGVIAKIDVNELSPASNGTIIATLVTSQKIAELSVNEVDVVKIKNGQKAELTFDAVDGLKLEGEVAEVDGVGAVSQGVVSYGIKIKFITADDRIKSGMSISANIITDSRENVLLVPNSAVKTMGQKNYVETLATKFTPAEMKTGVTSPTAPTRKDVQIGLSNDNFSEIISGLNEGDQVITKTTAGTAKATTAPNIFNAAGANSRTGTGAGTGVRIPR
ncbi:MAG: HlyD family efflux transporter periplasmic adaptor subunit [bacterium]|nr:HlyD family efflux transporter periplasmic adaptor subunit [bacterium]